MGRSPCCVKEGLNKGAWTSQEDRILTEHIKVHGEGKWRTLPKRAGLKRCGKSCRLRWLNYLRPDIKRGNITDDEEDLIIRLHKLLGNRWSLIAGRLPRRTDNEIKNYWNTRIGKRIEGHPSSSTKSKKNLTNNNNNPQVLGPPPNNVVRTKAFRCTKVFVSSKLEQAQQPGIMSTANTIENDFENNVQKSIVDAISYQGRIQQSCDDYFMMDDFEMDDKLLSEFLQGELCDFDIIGNNADKYLN